MDQIHKEIEDKYNNLVENIKQQTELIILLKQFLLERFDLQSPIAEPNLAEQNETSSLNSTRLEVLPENKTELSKNKNSWVKSSDSKNKNSPCKTQNGSSNKILAYQKSV